MRTKLATTSPRAAKAIRIFLRKRQVRSAIDWVPSVRRAESKENPGRLFERTSPSPRQRSDAGWSGRRFHAGGVGACTQPRVPADNARSDRFTGRDSCNLLPEHSLLRIVDAIAYKGVATSVATRSDGGRVYLIFSGRYGHFGPLLRSENTGTLIEEMTL